MINMLKVSGHIKDKTQNFNHKKMIPNGDYLLGIDFEVYLKEDSIDEEIMPIETSNLIIINAINNKYNTDFTNSFSYINPLRIRNVAESTKELIEKVNDPIFRYQITEAQQIMDERYYFGATCTFGVCLETLLLLLASKNNVKLDPKKSEIGPISYKLKKDGVISYSDQQRVLGTAKFRNIGSHSSGIIQKSDAENIRSTIVMFINKYF